MSQFIDLRLEPGLWLLGEWSLRWAVLIAALAAWFAIRPPRQAALRLAACQLVLVAGLVMPLIPYWWGGALLPAQQLTTTDEEGTEPAVREFPKPISLRPIAKRTKTAVASLSEPIVDLDSSHSLGPTIDLASSTPTAEPLGTRRIVLLLVALLWLVGTCVQLIRLIAASLWLSHLRGSALAPDAHSQELFDACRREIGLRRAVQLGTHSALKAPVFVGGWRCSVLVPSDWKQLPIEAQRAVLWHELAHVARRDDWAKLAEEAVRALFFFHPLVHWLLNRIDGYREQVCDAAAVRRGATGRMLAQILVDFTCRNSTSHRPDVALRPALPFFRRRTVKNRIHELLADETVARWSAPLLRSQFVGLALVAASAGVALGGLGPKTIDSASEVPLASNSESEPPASVAPNSSNGKEPHSTDTAVGLTTLERILAHWKARQERTKSLYFAWETRSILGQEADARDKGKTPQKTTGAPPRLLHFRVWADTLDRARLDRLPAAAPKPTATASVKAQSVWDGTTLTRLVDSGDAVGSPFCTISSRRWKKPPHAQSTHAWPLRAMDLLDVRPGAATLDPLAVTYQPTAEFPSGPTHLEVVDEKASIDGLQCVQLRQGSANNHPWIQNVWVDPARDDVVVAQEWLFGEDEASRQSNRQAFSIEYQLDRIHGWVPARWTLRKPREFSVSTVTKFTINEKFPNETFTVKLPTGTVVLDETASEEYRVAQDGSKSEIVKFESLASLRARETLALRTDFFIQPQALKEAIEFIAARYQIPIFLDEKEFYAARIDVTREVQCTQEAVPVGDLLKSLLSQCSQTPIGFRIENEVLTISPKFAGQGPIQVPAVPVTQESNSPTVRQIQAVLNQPVDFSIEPQSLKDVIGFIAVRYQIPITLDPSITSTAEVKGAFPGIKLKSLLAILLEQYPKPLGFKIEDKALKVFPKAETPQPPAPAESQSPPRQK